MKEIKFKDIDLKNSPFLKKLREDNLNRLYNQLKQQDKERNKDVLLGVLAVIGLLVSMYLDPLFWRYIFNGY